MRIAYCCADPGIPVFGHKGGSRHVQEILRALRALGHAVTLFAARRGGPPPTDLADLPVVALPEIPRGSPAERERAALDANPRIRDTILAHGPFDLVYERYALWSWAGMASARALGVPGVLEVNAPLIEEQARYRVLCDRETALAVTRRTLGEASLLVAVSEGVRDWLAGFAETDGKIAVIPNGVDPERFAAVSAVATRSAESDVPTLGFVGSLKPWHGLDRLIDAFAVFRHRHPASRLLIVGDGPERTACEERAAAMGLNASLIFTGAVPAEKVPEWLAAIDIAVAPYPPSVGFYFSPLKVYEYMAAGRAVVAGRIGQIDGLIEDGVTGRLYPPGDPGALVEVLDQLARSPEQRARLGAAACAKVSAEHTWRSVAQRILARVESGASRPLPSGSAQRP
ncbi:MAG: glycosyltransferase family 4 protein [Chromatiales bacterium]|nr:glycosyltransferase family 4 protein [Chromatiales bacterium]